MEHKLTKESVVHDLIHELDKTNRFTSLAIRLMDTFDKEDYCTLVLEDLKEEEYFIFYRNGDMWTITKEDEDTQTLTFTSNYGVVHIHKETWGYDYEYMTDRLNNLITIWWEVNQEKTLKINVDN